MSRSQRRTKSPPILVNHEEDIVKKPVADYLVEKLFSRKLLVWVVATYCLFTGHISSDFWVNISSAYIGIEGLTDLLVKYKLAGKSETK